MARDRVLLRNDSDEPLHLDPGEEVEACLLFDPQVKGDDVVHFTPREEYDG